MKDKKEVFSKKISDEFDFFVHADLSLYRGKYIALVGKRVVASGDDAKKVWEEARKRYPQKIPTLAKLPREEALVLF